MNKKRLSLAVGAALAAASTLSHAAPFNSFDPRSMAMGGAGVAVGNAATAPFFNPSLLAATEEDDDFSMELPIIGARISDPEDFSDSIDAFQNANYIDNLNQSISLAESNTDPFTVANSYRQVAADTRALSSGLATLDGKPFQGELGAATVIAVPSKKWGVAVSANTTATFGAVVNYRDGTALNTLANDLDAYVQCAEDTLASTPCTPYTYTYIDQGTGDVLFDPATNVTSSVNARGLILSEVGLSLAREFTVYGSPMAIGITPKFVSATTFDYSASVDSSDTGDFADNTTEASNINLDIGLSKDFENGWRSGFVIKNLIGQEYDLMQNNQKTGVIELKPQARVGVSHQTNWSTVALDVDLTENDPVGFEDPTRYAALGVELNAFDILQLRAGYRADMVNSDRSVVSAGVGINLGLHVDVGVAANENEAGVSMQFGLRF